MQHLLMQGAFIDSFEQLLLSEVTSSRRGCGMIMNGQGGDYEMMSGTGLRKRTHNSLLTPKAGSDWIKACFSDIRLALIDLSVIRSTASADPP